VRPVAFNTWKSGNRAQVHGKWIGYRNDGGSWDAINAAFRNDGSAFVSDSGPFRFHVPQFANETAVLEINNRWDVFNRSLITSPAMVLEITPEGIGAVAGRIDDSQPSQVWYDDAWGPGLSLRYTVWHGRAPRATREAVIDPARLESRHIGQPLQASWLITCSKAQVWIGSERAKMPDGSLWASAIDNTIQIPTAGAAVHYFDGQLDQQRGSGFKAPQVWYWKADGTLVTQSATVTATIVDPDTIRLTKTIPAALVDAAAAEGSLLISDDVQTFYPDPHSETTTWDGHVGARNGDWATVIAANGSSTYSASHQTTAGITYDTSTITNHRFITLFDVSSLSGQSVESANWHCVRTGGYNRDVRLTGATTASNTGHTTTDYQNTFNDHDTDLTDAFQLDDTPVALNITGITHLQTAVDGSGIVKFCCRSNLDYIGSTSGPGGSQNTSVYTAESANDPYLEVTYGAAGGGGGGGGTDPNARRRRMLRMLCSCDSRKG
jgi:hypothetical protein